MVNLDAVGGYNKLFRLIGKYGGVAGVNMTQPNYRPTWITWIWVVMNGSYIFSALFTIITYNVDTKWMCANVLGISLQVRNSEFAKFVISRFLNIQGMVKYVVLMTHHERIYEKVHFLGKVYQSNTYDDSLNLKTLKIWSERGYLIATYT